MPLDPIALREALGLAVFEYHEEIGSTNDRAREFAADGGAPLPAMFVAAKQSAGRGRGVNRWWTGPGGLAASLVIDPGSWGLARHVTPQLSLATAVSLVDALAGDLPAVELGLHWPNDVFASGRKLAGILVEALADGRHIVGFGINTNNTVDDAPPELRNTATTVRDLTGQSLDHGALLMRMLNRLWELLARLGVDAHGLADRYDELCLQKGKVLCLDQGGTRTVGRCLGVAGDGALILETDAGPRTFHGGVLVHESAH